MKYLIDWMENKVSAKGNKYATLTLKKEDGTKIDATIFTSFPNFETLKPADTVEGELKAQDYQGKTTYTLEVPKVATTGQTGAFKGQQIAKAQETKARYIATAQGNKELGIMTSSTIRMATDIALAESQNLPWDTGVFKGRVKR